MIRAGAENEGCGDEIVELFLQRGYVSTNRLTEEIFRSAARNQHKGKKVLELLLEHRRAGHEMLSENLQRVLKWFAPHSQSAASIFLLAASEGGIIIFNILNAGKQ